jgi:hypothetical protein
MHYFGIFLEITMIVFGIVMVFQMLASKNIYTNYKKGALGFILLTSVFVIELINDCILKLRFLSVLDLRLKFVELIFIVVGSIFIFRLSKIKINKNRE